MKKVTIFGATGMLGEPVTRQLIKDGYQVKALVRETARAKKIFPVGVQFTEGDLEDLYAIRAAIGSSSAIYISLSNKSRSATFNAEKHGLKNILEVAKAMQVKQVVFLSSFLARNYQGDWWMYLDKQSGIEMVKKSGIPYTIFYAANFMENFNHGMVMGNKVRILKHPVENRSFWIAAADYALLVSAAFKNEQALNQEYAAQGPMALTMREVAARFAENCGKGKLKVSETPFGLINFISLFVPSIRVMMKMAKVNIYNNEEFESGNTQHDLGVPSTTIERFARQQI